ncbi:FAD-dependent oxidoreductase [Paenibacillus aurantius]|uniref:FAD-dependent oxidoreductase n=1 Tax=Paenibacillus aurantius TaxID=2918900 RepID=A0AA96RDY8_9BACL|nr:FAD-dependent oxidoreductase [Paenibacillus aurantius]WNQ09628.1 FAD-dependent oxidoreductase [Paenibacillus aurantius]
MVSLLLLFTACKEKLEVVDNTNLDPNNPDIVVIGSEIEGIYLARAAKDEGLSIVVLDPRDLSGGQLIQGEMHYLDEAIADGGRSLLQGRVKELFDRYKKGDIRKAGEFSDYYKTLIEGIPVETAITITTLDIKRDAKTSNKTLHSISYRTKEGEEKKITAKYWVENTDFSAITSRLGISRIPGIETVFNETGKTKDYMAASMMMKFRNVDWDKFKREINRLSKDDITKKYGGESTVTDKFTWGFGNVGGSYKASSKEVFLRGLNTINQRDGEVLINALLLYNVDPAREESIRNAIELGKRETERILPHLRKELPGWENAEVNGFPNYLYIRDFDRYETEYILQASDQMSGKMFWDNVSIAGYPIDLQGTMDHPWGERKGDPDQYGIPLRAFIPKGYTNIITAGKNIGASAVAYGSARIQPNTSLAAEVIGIILARMDDGQQLTEVTEKNMKEFHDYINKKYGITLRGAEGKNKIKYMSEEQIRQLNEGRLTLH